MKIGIAGSVESGKSKFAKKLATAIGRFSDKPKVVDNYVQRLTDKTGYVFGYDATYPQNFQILFERWTQEQIVKDFDSITCGTMYETIIYAAVHANASVVNMNEDIEEFVRGRTAMTALGMFETMMFDYDILFYLPYPEENAPDRMDLVLNQKIPEILIGYNRAFATLDQSESKNVKRAIEIVKIFQNETSNQRPV